MNPQIRLVVQEAELDFGASHVTVNACGVSKMTEPELTRAARVILEELKLTTSNIVVKAAIGKFMDLT